MRWGVWRLGLLCRSQDGSKAPCYTRGFGSCSGIRQIWTHGRTVVLLGGRCGVPVRRSTTTDGLASRTLLCPTKRICMRHQHRIHWMMATIEMGENVLRKRLRKKEETQARSSLTAKRIIRRRTWRMSSSSWRQFGVLYGRNSWHVFFALCRIAMAKTAATTLILLLSVCIFCISSCTWQLTEICVSRFVAWLLDRLQQ